MTQYLPISELHSSHVLVDITTGTILSPEQVVIVEASRIPQETSDPIVATAASAFGQNLYIIDQIDLGEVDQERLEEIVHDAASQAASNAINSSDEVDYLLSQGWSPSDIKDALSS